MTNEEFQNETIAFFTQNHNGELKEFTLEKEIKDERFHYLIAKVKTSTENYWVIRSNHNFMVYAESSGKDADEIYKFHLKESKYSDIIALVEEESLIYGETNLSQEFIMAIGRLTINFSHLEFILSLFCGSHMGASHPINEIVTSELSFKQLLNISASIYMHVEKDSVKLKHFNELLKEAFKMEESRNAIIHSCYAGYWLKESMIRQKSTARAKRGFKKQMVEINEEEVHELADAMDNLSREFALLIPVKDTNPDISV